MIALGATIIRGDVYNWGSLVAAALPVGLPVASFNNFFLDHFIQGLTGGAAW
jgi:multiple sugar transport system permease protein